MGYQLYLMPMTYYANGAPNGPPFPTWARASNEHDAYLTSYSGFHWPERNFHIELLGFADDAKHTAVQAISGVRKLLPAGPYTKAELETVYASKLTDAYTTAQRNTLTTALEGVGFDCGWATASTTVRDLVRRLVRYVCVVQWMDGRPSLSDATELRKVVLSNLDSTVGSLAANTRTVLRDWMTRRGFDVAWITGTTTVREVVRYLTANLTFPADLSGICEVPA